MSSPCSSGCRTSVGEGVRALGILRHPAHSVPSTLSRAYHFISSESLPYSQESTRDPAAFCAPKRPFVHAKQPLSTYLEMVKSPGISVQIRRQIAFDRMRSWNFPERTSRLAMPLLFLTRNSPFFSFRGEAMSESRSRYSHFVYWIIQSGLTCGIAAASAPVFAPRGQPRIISFFIG